MPSILTVRTLFVSNPRRQLFPVVVKNSSNFRFIYQVVSVSSRESAHEEMEFDDQVDRVLTPGASAVEAVNVSSPESVHGAPEPETISSDEQDVADISSSKDSSIMEGCS